MQVYSTGHPEENNRQEEWLAGEYAEASTTPISGVETLVEQVLSYVRGQPLSRNMIASVQAVFGADLSKVRVVVFGGGTGLSTVIGGNSKRPDWPAHPFGGLKRVFKRLDVVVCTTDDGGSTGRLLKELPMIAMGDIRKCCLSMIREELLMERYALRPEQVPCVVQALFVWLNYRFPADGQAHPVLLDLLQILPAELRTQVPEALHNNLKALLAGLQDTAGQVQVDVRKNCLGNLLLAGAIMAAGGKKRLRVPSASAVQRGINALARCIGAPIQRVHAATAVPGELLFEYGNGVLVCGQSKSASARRGFPVAGMQAVFAEPPVVSSPVKKCIAAADLLIFAPGSLYTSLLPLLQIPELVEAVRANRHALKLLGANFWAQAGETDMSPGNAARSYYVSDLIDAYNRNVSGGMDGLFDAVLCADLKHIPGSVLRNYALENKTPIHLDRSRVRAMGLHPVEVTLFPRDDETGLIGIKHDSDNFALAVQSIFCAVQKTDLLRCRPPVKGRAHSWRRPYDGLALQHVPLAAWYQTVRDEVQQKDIEHPAVRELLLDLIWQNRDIAVAHLHYVSGIRVVAAADWGRSNEWDNVLGYYDPASRFILLHERLLDGSPAKLEADLMIALGESLLGNYAMSKQFRAVSAGGQLYQLKLTAEEDCCSYLSRKQLCRFLELARMIRNPAEPSVYQLLLNAGEGFLPTGVLFGLMFAWYLNNQYTHTMEYEMELLRWPPEKLVPHQAMECIRRRQLVAFFRNEVFGHGRGTL